MNQVLLTDQLLHSQDDLNSDIDEHQVGSIGEVVQDQLSEIQGRDGNEIVDAMGKEEFASLA